jgi:putative FmdB family regulatory protein
MPRFDFKCPACGKTFEQFQPAFYRGDKRMAKCVCGADAARIFTCGPSFKFAFRDGYDTCTGEYHPTKKHYEECKRRKGLVKVD